MAFYFITGVMGSGKSYFGTELVLECLKQGGYVHTNLPLKMDFFDTLGYTERVVRLPADPRKMVREDDTDLDDNGKPKLKSDYLVMGREGAENIIVLDEAALEFDSDSQMDKGEKERNKPIFKLVALCRHAGLDLYFISQSSDNVHAKLRRMAEQRIKCIKTERLPVVGWLLAALPWYGTFLRIYFQGTDKTPIAKTWHRWRQDVGDAYDTHGMRVGLDFRKAGDTKEPERKKGTETTQAKGKALALLVVILIVSLAAFSWWKGSGAYDKARAQTAPGPSLVSQEKPSTAAPLPPVPSKRSMEWAEWEVADEWPILSTVSGPRGVRVYTTGGLLAVGVGYQGEIIMGHTYHAGYHYFRTVRSRWVVARPFTPAEIADRRMVEKPKTLTESVFGKPL